MRTSLLFAILTACAFRAAAQDELVLASTIERVTVYRAGAQVQRGALANLPAGRSRLVFSGLTNRLVENSLQVRSTAEAVSIIGVRFRTAFPTAPEEGPEMRANRDSLDVLLSRERRLRTELAIGEEEELVLQANRDLGGTASGLQAEDLERGVRYHRERIAAIRLERLRVNDALRAVERKKEELAAAYAKLALDTAGVVTGEVVVELETDRPVRDSMYLSYVVADASWHPAYDVRVSNLDAPLQLDYRARVSQATGEDWNMVRLVLSTGDPSRTVRLPSLQVWQLAPNRRPPFYRQEVDGYALTETSTVSGTVTDEQGKVLIGATLSVPGTNMGTVTDLDGSYTLGIPPATESVLVEYVGYESRLVPLTGNRLDVQLQPAAALLEEVVVVGYANADGRNSSRRGATDNASVQPTPSVPVTLERQPTSLAFAIDLPYTIPSGERYRSVEIGRHTVPVAYRHTAVPKIDDRVFLSAVVRNWEGLDLISGEMQLIVDGTYLGTSRLEVKSAADSLVISLGPDPGVIVTREPSERFTRTGGLLGGKQVAWRGWTIAARNTKTVPVQLVVLDQVPVSVSGTIDVDPELPEGVAYDKRSGQLRWQTVLAPGQGWTEEFGYRIRYSSAGTIYLE